VVYSFVKSGCVVSEVLNLGGLPLRLVQVGVGGPELYRPASEAGSGGITVNLTTMESYGLVFVSSPMGGGDAL